MKNKVGKLASGKRLAPWRSLAWQLIFLTILPLTALVLVVAFGSLAVHQNAMRMLVGERDERAVLTAAAALEEQINHRTYAVQSLALLGDHATPEELPAILDSLNHLLSEFDGGMAFLHLDGSLAAVAGNDDLWDALVVEIAPLVQNRASEQSTQPYLSSALRHPKNGEALVLILVIAPSGSWTAGGLYSAPKMVQHTLANAFANGDEASVAVIDPEKRLLFVNGAFSKGQANSHPGVKEALQGESGAQYIMVGEEEHVVAYSPIAPLGWALVLEEPWEMVESPTMRVSQLAPLVLAPILILAVVALWFGSRQIVKPLQTLESRAATLSRGDFKTIEEPVGGIEEIRQLQSELTQMARKLQAAQQGLHGYIGAITAAQEEERRRLARELHDDTIQALIALTQRVQLTQMSAKNAAPEQTALQEIAALTEQTIENLRRLTRALRPIYLEDLGLVTALEMLAREAGQTLNIPVEFQRQGMEKRLDPAVELALYRMVQEAFSNIARHSRATQASLAVHFSPDLITIAIHDNGKGFTVPKSPAEFAPGGHYGLLGLYERAELIGGAIEIYSEPGQGTRINIRGTIREPKSMEENADEKINR